MRAVRLWLEDGWVARLAVAVIAVTSLAALRYGPAAGAAPLLLLLAVWAVAHPRLGVALWLGCMFFVPYWLTVDIGLSWPPQAVLALLLLPAILAHGPHVIKSGDWLFAAFIAFCALAFLSPEVPGSQLPQMVIFGPLAYLVGRYLVPAAGWEWSIKCLVFCAAVAGAFAVWESVTGSHPFEGFAADRPQGFWSTVLERDGKIRSEGAFGHPIALAGALAFSVPFLLTIAIPRSVRYGALTLVTAGCMTTISRGPLLALGLGAVLTVLFSRDLRSGMRVLLATVLMTLAVPLAMATATTISSAGDEAEISAKYRSELYDSVMHDVRPLSLAYDVSFDGDGQQLYGPFESIDSSFVQTALVYGWLPVALVLLGLLALWLRTLSGRASPAQIALAAQVPVLATVALITQYRLLVFFVVGLAVAAPSVKRPVAPAWSPRSAPLARRLPPVVAHPAQATERSPAWPARVPGPSG